MTPSPEQTAVILMVPAGWRRLVQKLIADALAIDPRFTVTNAKEKYGGLRLDFEASGNRLAEIESLVDAAERESEKTCQICGAPAMQSTQRGRISTFCEQHAAT